MKTEYAAWIEVNAQDPYGQCDGITQQMVEAFPELTRVRGHYYCHVWGERQHWWLTTPENEIVDPTVAQFPSKGTGHYEPWDESAPEPTGQCPNCGGYTYKWDYYCSKDCGQDYPGSV